MRGWVFLTPNINLKIYWCWYYWHQSLSKTHKSVSIHYFLFRRISKLKKKKLVRIELVRYVCICSDILNYEEIKSFFDSRLHDRGFPIDFLDAEFFTVHYWDRYTFLSITNFKTYQLFTLSFLKWDIRKYCFCWPARIFRNCEGDLFCLFQEKQKSISDTC